LKYIYIYIYIYILVFVFYNVLRKINKIKKNFKNKKIEN